MATITAAQDGEWSDTATWVGAVVPVTGDSIDLDGHTVVFDLTDGGALNWKSCSGFN